MAISTFIASLVLADESDKNYAYIFGVIWESVSASIIALRKEYITTWYSQINLLICGIAMFAGKILSWIPLLMFFVLYGCRDHAVR